MRKSTSVPELRRGYESKSAGSLANFSRANNCESAWRVTVRELVSTTSWIGPLAAGSRPRFCPDVLRLLDRCIYLEHSLLSNDAYVTAVIWRKKNYYLYSLYNILFILFNLIKINLLTFLYVLSMLLDLVCPQTDNRYMTIFSCEIDIGR